MLPARARILAAPVETMEFYRENIGFWGEEVYGFDMSAMLGLAMVENLETPQILSLTGTQCWRSRRSSPTSTWRRSPRLNWRKSAGHSSSQPRARVSFTVWLAGSTVHSVRSRSLTRPLPLLQHTGSRPSSFCLKCATWFRETSSGVK